MEILYFLIPIAFLGLGIIVRALLWTVHHGQYDDLDGPAYRILMDDDDPRIPIPSSPPRAKEGAMGYRSD